MKLTQRPAFLKQYISFISPSYIDETEFPVLRLVQFHM